MYLLFKENIECQAAPIYNKKLLENYSNLWKILLLSNILLLDSKLKVDLEISCS